jgi:hypothetical protein
MKSSPKTSHKRITVEDSYSQKKRLKYFRNIKIARQAYWRSNPLGIIVNSPPEFPR